MPHLDFYFDLSSPYSYLAATQLPALAARTGATIAWKPVVLGAVFQAMGNRMPAAVPAKAGYMLQDLQRWARRYGVPFQFTSRFPVNAITAHRLILVAGERGPELAMDAFSRLWAHDEDITAPDTLVALAQGVGLDPADALVAMSTPVIKDQLRALTDEAIAAGMFGAPAFVVHGDLYWGNDRLDFVEEALRTGGAHSKA